METVFILMYNDLGTNSRSIFGVYSNLDSANDAINDDLYMNYRQCLSGNNENEKLNWFYSEIDPEIEEWKINK